MCAALHYSALQDASKLVWSAYPFPESKEAATSVTPLLRQLLTFHINCKLVAMETHIQEKFLFPARDQMAENSQKPWVRGLSEMFTGVHFSPDTRDAATPSTFRSCTLGTKVKVCSLLPAKLQLVTRGKSLLK